MIADPSLATRARPRRGPRGRGPPIVDRARPGAGPARVPAVSRRRAWPTRRSTSWSNGSPRSCARSAPTWSSRSVPKASPATPITSRWARRRPRRSTAAASTGRRVQSAVVLVHPALDDRAVQRGARGHRQGADRPDPAVPAARRARRDDRCQRGLLDVVDRKRAAIREHRTQANDFSDELEDEVFRHEPHVIGLAGTSARLARAR